MDHDSALRGVLIAVMLLLLPFARCSSSRCRSPRPRTGRFVPRLNP